MLAAAGATRPSQAAVLGEGAEARGPRASDLVDNRFAQRLREMGFLEALWRRPIPPAGAKP